MSPWPDYRVTTIGAGAAHGTVWPSRWIDGRFGLRRWDGNTRAETVLVRRPKLDGERGLINFRLNGQLWFLKGSYCR